MQNNRVEQLLSNPNTLESKNGVLELAREIVDTQVSNLFKEGVTKHTLRTYLATLIVLGNDECILKYLKSDSTGEQV